MVSGVYPFCGSQQSGSKQPSFSLIYIQTDIGVVMRKINILTCETCLHQTNALTTMFSLVAPMCPTRR